MQRMAFPAKIRSDNGMVAQVLNTFPRVPRSS